MQIKNNKHTAVMKTAETERKGKIITLQRSHEIK